MSFGTKTKQMRFISKINLLTYFTSSFSVFTVITVFPEFTLYRQRILGLCYKIATP